MQKGLLSFSISAPLSVLSVYVPGPGLLTLACPCVVPVPEGMVLGSVKANNG